MDTNFSELFDKYSKVVEENTRKLEETLGKTLKDIFESTDPFFDNLIPKKEAYSRANLFEYIANKQENNCSIPIIYMFVDIAGEIVIYLLFPFHKKEDLKITRDNDRIIVTGSNLPKEDKNPEMYSELGYLDTTVSEFKRILKLPIHAIPEKMRSSFSHGILKIFIPIRIEEKETINIEIS